MASSPLLSVIAIVLLVSSRNISAQGLKVGFYKKSCPKAESTIQSVVAEFFRRDRTVPAALLRLHFHDCFVRGCDASVLLNSTSTNRAEKEAGPNTSVRGYDLVDAAKAAVEKACQGVVSCADVLALATRDSVVLAGGRKYELPTGRKDGKVSIMSEANTLPDPGSNANQAITAFAKKGLTPQDLVLLLGAHTLGITHCNFVRHRLFNFQGTGSPDPSMDRNLVMRLQRTCTANTSTNGVEIFLDQKTPFSVDKTYFDELVANRGILVIDQQLRVQKKTDDIVQALASGTLDFNTAFSNSMIRMGNLPPPAGSQGEIRRVCGKIN